MAHRRSRSSLLAIIPLLVLASIFGRSPHQAAAVSGILAPWPPNISYVTTMPPGADQAPCVDHCAQPDLYAWDFGLFYGNTIAAAHSGTILRMVMGWGQQSPNNCNSAYSGQANYIVLDHGNGQSTIYWHMQQNSNQVSAAQFVYQGRPLGGADDSGYSCGSHIHFALETTPLTADPPNTNTLPVDFDDIGHPAKNSSVTSRNHP